MTPFRWANCYADIGTGKHGLTIRDYFAEVIVPSLRRIEERIDTLGRSEDAGDVFAQRDMEDMLQETKLAFCLSLQSIWERQLRTYLQGCARELEPGADLNTRIANARWDGLQKLFRRLRGIDLERFPSFERLDFLHHLGNACRHGEGASLAELGRRAPHFWSPVPPLPEPFDPAPEIPRSLTLMNVPEQDMRGLVEAVAQFWEDTGYIYNESLRSKDPYLVARLERERATRAWIPQAGAEA
jgi:hypothetical protein